MNRYNVDLRPPIAQLMDDLVNYRNLNAKGAYIKKLKAMEHARLGRLNGQ